MRTTPQNRSDRTQINNGATLSASPIGTLKMLVRYKA